MNRTETISKAKTLLTDPDSSEEVRELARFQLQTLGVTAKEIDDCEQGRMAIAKAFGLQRPTMMRGIGAGIYSKKDAAEFLRARGLK